MRDTTIDPTTVSREIEENTYMADQPPDTSVGPGGGATYSTPRWVKVSGIIVLIVVLLVVVVLVTGLGGQHGPSRHTSSGDAGNDTPPIQQEVQPTAPDGG